VVSTPAEPFVLTPGQSQTVHLAPAAGVEFPAGTKVDYPFTNNFNPADCEPPVTIIKAVVAPEYNTPDCTNPNMTVTPNPTDQVGVVATPAEPFVLTPGQSGTVDYTAAQGYELAQGLQTHWSFTNDFDVEDCVVIPPAVFNPKGNVQTDCTHVVQYYLNNTASSKGQAATYRLTLGGRQWMVEVAGDKSRTISRHGKTGQVAKLFVAGNLLDQVKVKGDCGPDTPDTPDTPTTPQVPTGLPDTGYTAPSASVSPASSGAGAAASLAYVLVGLCLTGALLIPATGKQRVRKSGVR
jgi:hypothetical protein